MSKWCELSDGVVVRTINATEGPTDTQGGVWEETSDPENESASSVPERTYAGPGFGYDDNWTERFAAPYSEARDQEVHPDTDYPYRPDELCYGQTSKIIWRRRRPLEDEPENAPYPGWDDTPNSRANGRPKGKGKGKGKGGRR